MKKLDIFKTIQLIIYVFLTGFCIYKIMMDPEVYQYIATNPSIRLICACYGLYSVCLSYFCFLTLTFSHPLRGITGIWTLPYIQTLFPVYQTVSAVTR